MAKKNWIYIKRGLSEDPKHRSQMGECIWLYMHIIDRADWETGIVYDWKDGQEAVDMGMPVDTLRRQRQKLEEGDYIRCSQKQYKQEIMIMEWKNPRDYSCEVKNPRNQGMDESLPLNEQGLNHGLNHVTSQVKTPTSNSLSESIDDSSKPKDKMDTLLEFEKPAQRLKDAQIEFETQLGFNPAWSNPDWERQNRKIADLLDKDPNVLKDFSLWRKGDGKYQGLTNASMAKTPNFFMDVAYPTFLASVEMKNQTRSKEKPL